MRFINNCDDVKYIRRYTTLPVLLDMLMRNEIPLLKPDTWKDKNDVEVMKIYQMYKNDKKKKEEKKKENTKKEEMIEEKKDDAYNILAACFTTGRESVYHWEAFSESNSGCMIKFNFERLKERLNSYNLVCGKVKYVKLNMVNKTKCSIDEIPFRKRAQYKCEEELRMIFFAKSDMSSYPVNFDMSCVAEIALSPNMPEPIADTVTEILKSIVNNSKVKIHQSTLLKNKQWIGHFKNKTEKYLKKSASAR